MISWIFCYILLLPLFCIYYNFIMVTENEYVKEMRVKHMRKIMLSITFVLLSALLFGQGSKAESDDPKELMEALYITDMEIAQIEQDYVDRWEAEKQKIERSIQPSFDELEQLEPEIWETDREFERRLKNERDDLHRELSQLLTRAQAEMNAEKQERLAFHRELRQRAAENLSGERVLTGSDLIVSPQEYDRNERRWPIRVSSRHTVAPFTTPLEHVIDFDRFRTEEDREEMIKEIIDFNEAAGSGRLDAEVIWSITQDGENRFLVNLHNLTIINPIDGSEYERRYYRPLISSAYRVERNAAGRTQVVEAPVITDTGLPGEIRLSPGQSMQLEPSVIPSNALNTSLVYRVEDRALARVDEQGMLTAGEKAGQTYLTVRSEEGLYEESIPLTIEYRVGDRGPAGGIVFYDGGDYSMGWRYMEAASEDIYAWSPDGGGTLAWAGPNIEIYDKLMHEVQTSVRIGSGLDNTQNIAQFIGSEENAAQLALDYEAGGEEYWFLPSRDELEAMVTYFLENHEGSEQELTGHTYWSSSISYRPGFLGYTRIWEQTLHTLEQRETEVIYTTGAVRPVRYF